MYPVRVVVECVCVQIIIWKVRYSTLSLFFCSVFICALMFYVLCTVHVCVSVVNVFFDFIVAIHCILYFMFS